MIEISEQEFTEYPVDKDSSFLGLFAREKRWYLDKDLNVLAVLLEDKIDKDWSYVVLGLESDGYYRVMDLRTSSNPPKSLGLTSTDTSQLSRRPGKKKNRYLKKTLSKLRQV